MHIQSIGRVFRSDNPIIIDIVDEDRISKSHYSKRKKNYNELNCEIIELNLKQEEKVETDDARILRMHKERLLAHNSQQKD